MTLHVRPRKSIFAKPRVRVFPTREEAEQWMRETYLAGLSPRKTTRTVLWITDNLVPTMPYAGLPEFRYHESTIYLDGQTVATNFQTGKELKRQLLNHPKGKFLSALPCLKCGRLPRINLKDGTLSHTHEDCPTHVVMTTHALTPPPLQIAVWNRFLRRRKRLTKLEPVGLANFMILGALREPTDYELTGRIRNIEIL